MLLRRIQRGLSVIAMSGLFLVSRDLNAAENPMFKKLQADGVTVKEGEVRKLSVPIMNDGLDAKGQRQIIDKLIGEKYSWENFSRHAVVSPFMLTLSEPEEDKKMIGRSVDLAFIAYGDLNKLKNDDFLSSQFKEAESATAENSSQLKMLPDKELEQRALPIPKKGDDPRFATAEFTLLDKVRLSAVTQTVKTETDESVLIASTVDERFSDDKQWPNRWRSVSRDDAGNKIMGEPQKYSGVGSYIKVTRLNEPAGALFVEYHVVFSEPEGWFNGANLLRSKLPILAQDGVRKFRRNMEQEKATK